MAASSEGRWRPRPREVGEHGAREARPARRMVGRATLRGSLSSTPGVSPRSGGNGGVASAPRAPGSCRRCGEPPSVILLAATVGRSAPRDPAARRRAPRPRARTRRPSPTLGPRSRSRVAAEPARSLRPASPRRSPSERARSPISLAPVPPSLPPKPHPARRRTAWPGPRRRGRGDAAAHHGLERVAGRGALVQRLARVDPRRTRSRAG